MKTKYDSIYEVLDEIRHRPAMYIGHGDLSHLQAFIEGMRFSDLDPGTPPIGEFVHWLGYRVKGISKTLPTVWLENKYGVKVAVEKYFQYLDEFRACTPTIVLTTQFKAFDCGCRQYYSLEKGYHTPSKPISMAIGQYAPSQIFYLEINYSEHDLIKHEKEYCYSAKDAIKEAKNLWSVPIDSWQKTTTLSPDSE